MPDADPSSAADDFWARARALPGPADGQPQRHRGAAPARRPDRPAARAAGTMVMPSPPQAPPSPARPAPHPGAPGPARRRRPRRRWPWVLAALVLVPVVAGAGLWAYLTWQMSRFDQVPVGSVLAGSATGTNVLLVGSDSREGVDPNAPDAGFIVGDSVGGQRADTILVLRIDDQGSRFLSLPRDLWLPIPPTGREQRINAAYNEGPETLVRTVQESLGIPLDHYVEVDFVSFVGLVDALGGVTIDFAHPATDADSGLDVPAGPVTLDGAQGLAYVRSRNYTEQVDGSSRVDPRGDLGRVVRQQTFLREVLSEASAARNPLTLNRVLGALSAGVRIDDATGVGEALRIARGLRGQAPETVELPVFGFTTAGGAAVLGLADGAGTVLASFR